MTYKAIIFDMDGTIIESGDIWQKATIALLKKFSIEVNHLIDQELRNELHGLAIKQSCSFLKNRFSLVDDLTVLIEEKSKIANQLFKTEVKYIDGFTSFYKETQKYQLKTSIASNAADDTLLITDEVLNLKQFFGSHIYGISHVNYQGKPSPAIFLYAAQQLEIEPSQCIVIEDSMRGVHAAKNAGMYCIGINTNKNRQLLKEADAIIECYSEINLPKLLE